jgi:hypothetical protein
MDGMNWNFANTCPFVESEGCTSVTWTGTLWLASGHNLGAGLPVIVSSTDGANWTTVATTTTLNVGIFDEIKASGATYVTGTRFTAGTPIKYSKNSGVTWVTANLGTSNFKDVFSLATNGSMWIAGGVDSSNNNIIAYTSSFDVAPAWSSIYMAFTPRDIKWNGSYWLAAASVDMQNSRSIYRSVNGIDWLTTVSNPFPYTTSPAFGFLGCRALHWTGDRWYATGEGAAGTISFATSTNGENWFAITTNLYLSYGLGIAAAPQNPIIHYNAGITGSAMLGFKRSTALNSYIQIGPAALGTNNNGVLYSYYGMSTPSVDIGPQSGGPYGIVGGWRVGPTGTQGPTNYDLVAQHRIPSGPTGPPYSLLRNTNVILLAANNQSTDQTLAQTFTYLQRGNTFILTGTNTVHGFKEGILTSTDGGFYVKFVHGNGSASAITLYANGTAGTPTSVLYAPSTTRNTGEIIAYWNGTAWQLF